MNEQKRTRRGTFWMLFPVALLVVSVSGWVWMVSVAVDDPGFAVEPDYYKKASNYDDIIVQRAENERLGYQLRIVSFLATEAQRAEVVVAAESSDGSPLRGVYVRAEAMPVARAFDVQKITFEPRGDGVFAASVERPRPGLWEWRLQVTDEKGDVFTETLRSELFASGQDAVGPEDSPT